MGLDMYLTGRKYIYTNTPQIEDGFEVKGRELEIGYWRKHPNLHGFIVNEFADGVDECQPIQLSVEDLRIILDAVKKDALPHTEGFFFGESQPEDKPETIEILTKAIAWLSDHKPDEHRTVVYQASW